MSEQGGVLTYPKKKADAVKTAIENFIKNQKDPKAAIVAAFRYNRENDKIEVLLSNFSSYHW